MVKFRERSLEEGGQPAAFFFDPGQPPPGWQGLLVSGHSLK